MCFRPADSQAATKTCPKCGAENGYFETACKECGATLAAAGAPAAPAPSAPAKGGAA